MRIKNQRKAWLILGALLLAACGSKKKSGGQGEVQPAEDVAPDKDEAEAKPAATVVPVPRLGVRGFQEIYSTYAALTGVERTDNQVAGLFNQLRFTLPSETNDVRALSASHQAAILKLASVFCSRMVNGQNEADPAYLFKAASGENLPSGEGLLASDEAKKRLGFVFAERFWAQAVGIDDYKPAEEQALWLIDELAADGVDANLNRMAFAVCTAVLSSFQTIER